MNEESMTSMGSGADASYEEEQVRYLLETAGRRPEVPAEDLERITEAARAEWKARLRERRAGRFHLTDWRLLAAAAALIAAVAVSWWGWSGRRAHVPRYVASVETLSGVLTARVPGEGDEAAASPVSVGDTVVMGAELETSSDGSAPGRTALQLASGTSLRLDSGTRVRLVSATALELVRGAVYVDTGGQPQGEAALEVRTALGLARDIGTQFEVRILGNGEAAMRIRVREGTVLVERGTSSYWAVDGSELTLQADGSVTRAQVPTYGPEWTWILSAAPRMQIEGRTLREFLDWVGRETGWQIRFTDQGTAAEAEEIVLHGNIGHLTPDQAPTVVLPGAGLSGHLVDGILVVGAP